MSDNQPQLTPQMQNAMARGNLLENGISMIKRLQPQRCKVGESVRIPLQRMGIMTGVMLHISTTFNAAATPLIKSSQFGPHNLINNVMYTDFAGTNRIKTTGHQLWAMQCFKQGDIISGSPAQYVTPGSLDYNYHSNDNVFNAGSYSDEGTHKLSFGLYVPMAYDPASDLTGAVLTQTTVGEHYITVDIAKSLVGNEWTSPFTAGIVNGSPDITIEPYQYYIQPQNTSVYNLPLIDLSTIYAIEGGYQTQANIQAGSSTFINLPNNRSILSTYVSFENGGVFNKNESDVSLVTTIANSNTNFREQSPRLIRETMRNIINADMPSSCYYLGSRRQPILTQLYASVQNKFDIISTGNPANGPTQFITQYESQYPSGSPLPGIVM